MANIFCSSSLTLQQVVVGKDSYCTRLLIMSRQEPANVQIFSHIVRKRSCKDMSSLRLACTASAIF
ncbi:Uncharacterised protein [Vibrio cholerae]|nr:Uncharacterised protein [Vibrio cholerae]